jgi:hypothetical protein
MAAAVDNPARQQRKGIEVKLQSFSLQLSAHGGGRKNFRPFVCDGNPLECRAFVVGINPASTGEFWRFWSDARGFDRESWLKDYQILRRTACKPAESNTRTRLNLIAEAAGPHRLLETNIYATTTAAAGQLARPDQDIEPFLFLLKTIRPAAILVHGKMAQDAVERAFRTNLGGHFKPQSFKHGDFGLTCSAAVAPRHLSRVSFSQARDLGNAIRQVLEAPQVRP